MKGGSVRLSRRMNIWFYSVFSALFFSGVIWLAVHYSQENTESFEGWANSFESWLLRIHGAAALVSLVILGVLIPVHMQRAWPRRRNRFTAVVMVTLILSMLVSGYGLYYCGNDTFRSWISGLHSVIGSLLPLALVWHILSGRKAEANHRIKKVK